MCTREGRTLTPSHIFIATCRSVTSHYSQRGSIHLGPELRTVQEPTRLTDESTRGFCRCLISVEAESRRSESFINFGGRSEHDYQWEQMMSPFIKVKTFSFLFFNQPCVFWAFWKWDISSQQIMEPFNFVKDLSLLQQRTLTRYVTSRWI